MYLYLHVRFGQGTGVAFTDSTPLAVCHNRRIGRHQVFAGIAARGKSGMGWFHGFRLHLIVNDQGDLPAVHLTPANFDDRKPVPQMTKELWGKLVGDRGDLSKALFEQFFARGLQRMAADRPLPITPIRKNMKNRLVVLEDRLLTRERFINEIVVDQCKNVSRVQHTRHRSTTNFLVNLIAGLIAYTWQRQKPSLIFSAKEMARLPAAI